MTRLPHPSVIPPNLNDNALLDPMSAESQQLDPDYPHIGGLDQALLSRVARLTHGISPSVLILAYLDWLIHLGASPDKQALLVEKAFRKGTRLAHYAQCTTSHPEEGPCISPLPQDKRFTDPAWQEPPYNLIYQGFLLNQQWWHVATTNVRGVSKSHENIVSFVTRQVLDTFSPSNIPWLNPVVTKTAIEQGGMNFWSGLQNFVEDFHRQAAGRPPRGAEAFKPGRDVAVTPGKVIFRNPLMEVIQYEPQTAKVFAEPVLIVPAWIMKYYILDLSARNSLVNYLVSKGHTVFMISWHNPTAVDRNVSLDDYRYDGVLAALDAVSAVMPGHKIHATGYCLGGTILTIAAAAMARNGDDRLASITLLAAETDFTDAGELTLFINESQVAFLEAMMAETGYLDTRQMAGAFQMLRSNDLLWSRILHEYLLGRRPPMSDLMAWNADVTRMPQRMHSEYLRKLFLDNDLAEGRYQVDHRPIAISDIRIPIFAVATEKDHVAPWKSVYKINLLSDTDVTFLLTSGGHNAGIISEPGHPHRHFRLQRHRADDKYIDPESWVERAPAQEGSWWPVWQKWLAAGSVPGSPTPPMGAAEKGYGILTAAPGIYIHQA